MCRTCASFCHTSYMHNMYATCVRDMRCLHTCMLQVCCTCVSCMYAYYYSTAYMPLAHMQATSVPHMCSLHTYMHITTVLHTCRLHTCKLLVFLIICAACIHAVLHTCRLYTCKLLVFLICAACIHAYYYSAAYMHHIIIFIYQ